MWRWWRGMWMCVTCVKRVSVRESKYILESWSDHRLGRHQHPHSVRLVTASKWGCDAHSLSKSKNNITCSLSPPLKVTWYLWAEKRWNHHCKAERVWNVHGVLSEALLRAHEPSSIGQDAQVYLWRHKITKTGQTRHQPDVLLWLCLQEWAYPSGIWAGCITPNQTGLTKRVLFKSPCKRYQINYACAHSPV